MITSRSRTVRRSVAALTVAVLSVVGCSGSDGDDDPVNGGDPTAPVDEGTVVPPVDNGVGGGEPVDDLNDGDTQQPAQGGSNSDLDSNNGG